MASVRGLLNIQSLNELTYENDGADTACFCVCTIMCKIHVWGGPGQTYLKNCEVGAPCLDRRPYRYVTHSFDSIASLSSTFTHIGDNPAFTRWRSLNAEKPEAFLLFPTERGT